MTVTRGRVCVLAAALLAFSAGGCFTPMTVQVAYPKPAEAQGLRRASIDVHLVGVPESAYSQWHGLDVTDYFEKPDSERPPATKRVLLFGEGKEDEQVLVRSDSIWASWQQEKVAYLFILANLPGDWKARPGAGDPRRVILRLNSDCWPDYFVWDKKTIYVTICRGGLKFFYPGTMRGDATPQ